MALIEYRRRQVPPVVIVTNDAGDVHEWPLADFEADPPACLVASGVRVGPSVPDRVTAASLLLVLGQMGKLAQVEGVIAGLPEAAPARILWGRATEFRRANPLWEAFAQTIGLTAADVDAAFIAAGQMDQAFSNG